MPTITEAFILPDPSDLTAMGFVVRLTDEAAAAQKLVDDYVVTPTVAKALPEILDELEVAVKRVEDVGRFVHGSFGSGKSHFMALLGLLLEDHDAAWAKDDPAIAGLAGHRGWVRSTGPLVIRVHMLSQKGARSGLDDTIYAAFNRAMARHGKPPCSFRDAAKVYEDAVREAEAYGAAFFHRLEEAGITDRESFEALADDADPEELEDFARAWLEEKGGDTTVLDLPWGEGLQRMATHAREQGFGAIVLLVDEMLLWLGEKDPHQFRTEVNNLNTLVDHATGERAVPVVVYVARQRKISDFFPDLASDDELHEYIDHHSKRFQLTTLRDVELRHIVAGRVLRPRMPEAVEAARNAMAETHSKVLKGVLSHVDADYLRDVFPFHPGLIEMLVDVSSLLQRERSALTLLYELLVKHHPDLPLGEFLPVGSAFEAVFPKAGMVDASRKRGDLQRIHEAYWKRLRPAMKRLDGLSPEREKILDQVVKTVLLGEVSPRLKGSGLDVLKAVQLNSADTDGYLNRTLYSEVYTDLIDLQRLVPDLQVSGRGKTAKLTFDLGSVNFGELLMAARGRVQGNDNLKLTTFWEVLKSELGIAKGSGFRPGEANEGPYDVSWHCTRRRGLLKLANVRTVKGDDLICREDFRIVVDYPWDEPGHSVEDDRHRAKNVAKRHGNQYTICWLPRHFTPDELAIVVEIAAARHLRSDAAQEELMSRHSPADRTTVMERATEHEKQMRNRLGDILKEVYGTHGDFESLQNGVTVRAGDLELKHMLDHVAKRLLDRRWPSHPPFLTSPDPKKLRVLLDWMVAASDQQGHSVHYDESTGDALRKLAQPLELVDVGQTRATLRLDSRYIKDVLGRSDRATVDWDPIADHLQSTWGLQKPVRDLFLAFLCRARGFRALTAVGGEALEVGIGKPPASTSVRLQRARLLDHAAWSRVRELGPVLLGVSRPAVHRSVAAQDAVAEALRDAATARRQALQVVHEGVVRRGAGESARTAELSEGLSRLAPLVRSDDSFDRLASWLAAWPDEPNDPVRVAVQAASSGQDALNALDDNALELLGTVPKSPEIDGHLAHLKRWLGSEERTEPLTTSAMTTWNRTTHTLLKDAMGRATPAVRTPAPPPVRQARAPATSVAFEGVVDLGNPAAVRNAVEAVERALSGAGRVRVRVLLEPDA